MKLLIADQIRNAFPRPVDIVDDDISAVLERHEQRQSHRLENDEKSIVLLAAPRRDHVAEGVVGGEPRQGAAHSLVTPRSHDQISKRRRANRCVD